MPCVWILVDQLFDEPFFFGDSWLELLKLSWIALLPSSNGLQERQKEE